MLISVIIPALNEEAHVARAIASAGSPSTAEIIVVDGGSQDATLEIGAKCGAKTIVCEKGRARQMNAGATAAVGDVLLFLHADTCLPIGFDNYIHKVLSIPGSAAGAFQFSLDGPERALRLVERMVNWRSNFLQMPYGDQAIFLTADIFHAVGGFPDIPIMEDFELMLRLRRRGRIRIAPIPVLASARRWHKMGTAKQTIINQAVIVAYGLGVAPSRLARWYNRKP